MSFTSLKPRQDLGALSRLCPLSLCLEVAKQAGEGLLILVVIFPLTKVANVPQTAYISGPGGGGLHHSVIEFDGEEHCSLVSTLSETAFFFHCGLDFLFHPRTGYGMR